MLVAVTARKFDALTMSVTLMICADPVAVAVTVAAPPETVIVVPAAAVTVSANAVLFLGEVGVTTVGGFGATEFITIENVVAVETLVAASVAVIEMLLVEFGVRPIWTLWLEPVAVAVTVKAPPVTVIVEPASAVTGTVMATNAVLAPGATMVGAEGATLSWTTVRVTVAETLVAASVAVNVIVLVVLASRLKVIVCADPVAAGVATVVLFLTTVMVELASAVTVKEKFVMETLVGDAGVETSGVPGSTLSCTTLLAVAGDVLPAASLAVTLSELV